MDWWGRYWGDRGETFIGNMSSITTLKMKNWSTLLLLVTDKKYYRTTDYNIYILVQDNKILSHR